MPADPLRKDLLYITGCHLVPFTVPHHLDFARLTTPPALTVKMNVYVPSFIAEIDGGKSSTDYSTLRNAIDITPLRLFSGGPPWKSGEASRRSNPT
jgi:hypothetical protein